MIGAKIINESDSTKTGVLQPTRRSPRPWPWALDAAAALLFALTYYLISVRSDAMFLALGGAALCIYLLRRRASAAAGPRSHPGDVGTGSEKQANQTWRDSILDNRISATVVLLGTIWLIASRLLT